MIHELRQVLSTIQKGHYGPNRAHLSGIATALPGMASAIVRRSDRRITEPQALAAITAVAHHPLFDPHPLPLLLCKTDTKRTRTPEERMTKALSFGLPWDKRLRDGLMKTPLRRERTITTQDEQIEWHIAIHRQKAYQAIGISSSFESSESSPGGYCLMIKIWLVALHPIPQSNEFQIAALQLGRSLATHNDGAGQFKPYEWHQVAGGRWKTVSDSIIPIRSASALVKRPHGDSAKGRFQMSVLHDPKSLGMLSLDNLSDPSNKLNGDPATFAMAAGILAPLVTELGPILKSALASPV